MKIKPYTSGDLFTIGNLGLRIDTARVWYGDWHMTPFALFLIPYCALIYYAFEIMWKPKPGGQEKDGGGL